MTPTPEDNRSEEDGAGEPERVVHEVEVIYAGGADRPPGEGDDLPVRDGRAGPSFLDQVRGTGIVGLGCLAAALMLVVIVVTALVVGIPLAIARALKGGPREG